MDTWFSPLGETRKDKEREREIKGGKKSRDIERKKWREENEIAESGQREGACQRKRHTQAEVCRQMQTEKRSIRDGERRVKAFKLLVPQPSEHTCSDVL